MKKCPSCDKTFEDSMRFCQVDGTPLVEEAPAFDPYATIVAPPPGQIEPEPSPVFEAAVEEAPAEKAAAESYMNPTMSSIPIAEPEDVLDLPSDPLKTMYVSDSEMHAALGTDEPAPDIIEIPPIEEVSQPAPPSFIVPDAPAISFGEPAPPPSPFSVSDSVPTDPDPLVFEEPAAAPTVYDEPVRPAFDEAATMIQSSFNSPFDPPPPAPVAEWTPPPAPDASWQNREIGSNTPFQPPPAGTDGQNKTLPIISLVLGIISLCCYVSPLTGIAALITGFLGMKNANNDPANFGGKGLAIAGMITGGLFFLIGIVYWIFILFFGGLAMIMDAAR